MGTILPRLLPKGGVCSKWLTLQDTWQQERFPTHLQMVCRQAFCISTLIPPPHPPLTLSSTFPSPPLCTHDHLRISLFRKWSQAWSSLLRETLNFTFGLFLIAYLSPQARNLNWKTKIWCTCTFRGRPITANETLVNQIALKGFESREGFGSIPASWYHPSTCVWLPSSAITPLAQSFLSQHFYCICCPRQTAIKPR